MEFNYSYKGSSTIDNYQPSQTSMSFSPDTQRKPTYFSGELAQGVEFREAISALHEVVVSDLRFKPTDKSAYKAWVAQQEQLDWVQINADRQEVQQRIQELSLELQQLESRQAARMAPFYRARRKYFDYLYEKEKEAWFVLDPVITVHPDEIFFECFSQDESSYGRLGVNYEVFRQIGEFACGTTNIDYSDALYQEFQKIRSYKKTFFQIDPSGFEVQMTGHEDYKEVKIDLPDSWVRGFLQVNSAMALPAIQIELHPMDVYNLCLVLRRHKEKQGPRSMRYCLKPGHPVKVVFDPWGLEVLCPRSCYEGSIEQEIRVWGRRRILILERLIPLARKFTVHLLGQGMPSFYVADLGEMSFTLGLSGWTANDWATAGNFDLMAPRAQVDTLTQQAVFGALCKEWYESPNELAQQLNLEPGVVLGTLGAYTQAGRAMYDLNKRVYRVRELSREPLPMDQLRFANPREESASRFLSEHKVQLKEPETGVGMLRLNGSVAEQHHTYYPWLEIDADQRLQKANCSCNWYTQNKLYKGPCEHMLALRMAYYQVLERR